MWGGLSRQWKRSGESEREEQPILKLHGKTSLAPLTPFRGLCLTMKALPIFGAPGAETQKMAPATNPRNTLESKSESVQSSRGDVSSGWWMTRRGGEGTIDYLLGMSVREA